MKNKVNFIYKFLLSAVLLTAVSCEDMLEVDPRQSIDSESALTSVQAIEAATNSVYARLRQVTIYGRDLIAIPELLSDNAENTGAGNRLTGQATNAPGAHMDNWQQAYYAINEANLILEALPTVAGMNESSRNAIAGQLHFLRALFYFDLMRVYAYAPTAVVEAVNRGGVPIYEKGVLSADQFVPKSRASIAEVFQFIYNDLDAAIAELEGTVNSRAPHYATKWSAMALYSRVALYNGDYAKVIEYSTKVINATSVPFSFMTAGNYVSGWRSAVNPESIFEIVFTVPDNIGVNESLRASFTTRMTATSTTSVSHGNVVVRDALYNDYAATDVRRQLIIRGLGNNSARWETTKFVSKNGTNNLDNVPVIRLSEMYLNRAEAYAMPGANQNEAASNQDLNTIITRAGLATVNLSGQALINEIVRQRRLEFSFEGHRFFDLKRLGRDIVKTTNVEFEDFRILAGIPTREIDANQGLLIQNQGY